MGIAVGCGTSDDTGEDEGTGEGSPVAEPSDEVGKLVSLDTGVGGGAGVITEVTVVPDVNVVPAVMVFPLVTTTTEVTTVGETMTVVFVAVGAFCVFVVVFSGDVVELVVVVVEVHSTPKGGKNPTPQPPPKGPPKARWSSVVGPRGRCMAQLNHTVSWNRRISGKLPCSGILTRRARQQSRGREAARQGCRRKPALSSTKDHLSTSEDLSRSECSEAR